MDDHQRKLRMFWEGLGDFYGKKYTRARIQLYINESGEYEADDLIEAFEKYKADFGEDAVSPGPQTLIKIFNGLILGQQKYDFHHGF